MDGADAPSLFSGSRESGWAALPANDSRLDEDLPPGNGGFANDRLPYAPAWSTSISADYEWSAGNSATAFIGGTVRLIGDQFGDFNDNYQTAFGRRYRIEGFATADLRAGIDFERFSIGAYVRNLTNSRGLTSVRDFLVRPGTSLSASSIRPRTIGVTVGAEF